MNRDKVLDLVRGELLPLYQGEHKRLREIDKWYRWHHEAVIAPRGATEEHKRLAELARTPWLGLVVSSVSQAMIVDGYKSPDDGRESGAWRTWNENKYNARQVPLHRATLAYGYAFSTVLPGVNGAGLPTSVMRGVSPLNMQALYADPAEDDWPICALRVYRDQPGDRWHLRFYDERDVHYLTSSNLGDDVEWLSYEAHNAGVTPVVRYANQLDLEGRVDGEVEPFIPLAGRINKTDYDRLLTQHFSSWKVRYVTGLQKPDDEADAQRTKMRLRQDDILVAEVADAKFGTLDGSPLDGFLAAHDADVEDLAAASQTPMSAFGKLDNLSADALAAARAQFDQKVGERKLAIGESHAQALRLAAALEGNADVASDVTARITWQDTSIRSIAQAVDALGKAATMLQIPPRALWGLIPGVTKSDVTEWANLAKDGDPFAQLDARLAQQAANGPQAGATPAAA